MYSSDNRTDLDTVTPVGTANTDTPDAGNAVPTCLCRVMKSLRPPRLLKVTLFTSRIIGVPRPPWQSVEGLYSPELSEVHGESKHYSNRHFIADPERTLATEHQRRFHGLTLPALIQVEKYRPTHYQHEHQFVPLRDVWGTRARFPRPSRHPQGDAARLSLKCMVKGRFAVVVAVVVTQVPYNLATRRSHVGALPTTSWASLKTTGKASTSDNMENSSSEDEIPASDIMLISTQHGNDVVNSGTIALDKLFDEEQHPTATESNTCCPFLSVPNEIILLFVEKGSLDRNSLRDLALTSSRLFQVTRPIFYKGYNYEAFRRAVNQFDVAAMERCALFDAAPVDFEWNVPSPCWVYSDDSDDILERGWTKTPLATLEKDLGHEHRRVISHPGIIAANTFAGLLRPESYREWAYPGEFADMMEEKVNLLIKYKAVDDVEQDAFEKLAGALKEISRLHPGPGNRNREQHALLCWHKICMSLRFLSDRPHMGRDVGDHGRLHVFSDSRREPWDPRSIWLDHVLDQTGWNPWFIGDKLSCSLWSAMALDSQSHASNPIRWYDEDVGLWMNGLTHTMAWMKEHTKDIYEYIGDWIGYDEDY
ncbi:hypothetical protein B0J13DRAFT_528986 [Dactylonectria estremocensis]|uniref:Uncharacterized protein n=1 Tax=Dactylonectria estremocensis TaxID=1079267 RepID=A0A9P9IW94_9HYPO|nr:hypothetical protein B0J13DRAFT_528986 [Dactylonectria estremocensis]